MSLSEIGAAAVAKTTNLEGSLFRRAAWTLIYVVLTWCTGAYFMADTIVYVGGVNRFDEGINYLFWDFRHLFWRPLGWVVFHLLHPLLPASATSDPRLTVTYIFLTINWLAGLA